VSVGMRIVNNSGPDVSGISDWSKLEILVSLFTEPYFKTISE
jgi:hypothetical protein